MYSVSAITIRLPWSIDQDAILTQLFSFQLTKPAVSGKMPPVVIPILGALSMGTTITVSDTNFRAEVLESPGVTIMDLWAEWCGPCKRLAPIMEQIGTEYAGQIKVTKLDVDANPDIPGRYQVMGLPTVLVFKTGQLVETIVGFMPKEKILKRILPHLE
jgi:thioredoxin 1